MTLNDILAAARRESEERQRQHSLAKIRREAEAMGPTRGFARALRQRRFSVIGEIKRKSPSMASIAAVDKWAPQIYHEHPVVSAISVLTQREYFGGTMQDLEFVRAQTQRRPKPILRKDFIFEEYEVYFSRWIGADAILLMANVVTDPLKFKALHDLALSLGLDVLCEIHDQEEIDIIPDNARICGINSRKFKNVDQRPTFGVKVRKWLGKANRDTQTDLSVFKLFDHLPPDCIKIAESGVSVENVAEVLTQHPFNAALIGTSLLRAGKLEMRSHLSRIHAAAEKALDSQPSVPTREFAYSQ